jgi:hypothetical protein
MPTIGGKGIFCDIQLVAHIGVLTACAVIFLSAEDAARPTEYF